ncbi:MAG: protein kinase [Planctomycetaceae bacterium]|nr:protein kinase [Planctomycetaceae bacterium]
MAFKTLDELTSVLVRLRLVEPQQVDDCLPLMPRGSHSPADLLDVLGNAHHLTPWQVSQLQKGQTDSLVLGDYKLLYKNASGSFARVWRACSVTTGKMVGLKVLRERWARDPKAVAEFRREAELCMKLRHPNIVPIYDVGSQGDWHYFSMDFVEGGNLRDFISIRRRLSAEEAVRYTLHMARGLEYAISRGATHRDMKMTNVLLSIDGVARLADFGLAGRDEADSGSDDQARALEYAALEKYTKVSTNDPRSDLFFLGAIFYELLSGRPAWEPTRSRDERSNINRYSSVRPLRTIAQDIPQEVVQCVEKLLQIDPNKRYQSATELVAALTPLEAALADGTLASTDSIGTPQPAQQANGPVRTGAAASRANDGKPAQQTVLCVENRMRHQDALRDYLTKHGYRVLVLANLDRALARLENNPPDCLLLMGDSLGSELARGYQTAAQQAEKTPLVVVGVLAESQARLKKTLPAGETTRLVVQPVTLRALRREIHAGLQHLRRQSGRPATSG